MTTDHDHDDQLRDIARALVADAPDAPHWDDVAATPLQRPGSRRWLAGAVAATVLVGVGGIVASRSGDEASRGSGAPPDSGPTETTVFAVNGAPTTVSTEQTYVVVAGDFLAGIAVAHCVAMEELAAYNDWQTVDQVLVPGDAILIPPGACAATEMNGAISPSELPIVPEGFFDTEPHVTGSFAQVSWDNPPNSRALIGRIENGNIVEALRLEAGPDLGIESDIEPVTVFGQNGALSVEPGTPELTTVVWSESPPLSLSGLDPLAFLGVADPGFATAVSAGISSSAIEFGVLPDGWDVIVEPQPVRPGSVTASMVIDRRGDAEGISVEIDVTDPLLSLATVGPLFPVDVNGTAAWMTGGPQRTLTWQFDPTTYVLIHGSWSADETLALARSIEWVDVGMWMSAYHVDLPVFPAGGPREPAPVPTDTTSP